MAPRAYWKGSLKLSLVSCPVQLYPASTSVEKTRFHMINKETGNRLKQQMIDAETGDVVESDQKGRGYELKKGQYVEIEKEELEAVQIGHPDVNNRNLRMELDGHGKSFPGRASSDDVMRPTQHALNGAKHAGFVVHDQNARRSHEHCACGCGAAWGTPTWTQVPLPGSL